MIPILSALATRRWFIRWPVKLSILAAVTCATLYPSPTRLRRHIEHIRHHQQLTDPDQPALAPVREEFLRFAEQHKINIHEPEPLMEAVETFVYERVPYAWDWDTWGVADYLPTVDEVLASGREDCDGRAVLAAALLRSFDVHASLVADPRHVWVRTPTGDLMSPLGAPTFEGQADGLRVRWAALLNPAPLAFGVAVFPLVRELIILLAVWLLVLPARISPAIAGLVLLCLVESLILVRFAGAQLSEPHYLGLAWAAAHWPLAGWLLWRYSPGASGTAARDAPPVAGGS